MALENIISAILSETEKEIQEIKKQAEIQIKKILTQAEEQAQKIKAQALENFRIEKLEEAKLVLREKQNNNYRAILGQKKKILDDVFARATKILQTSENKKLIKNLKKNLPENGQILENAEGGFRFVSDTLEIDNTFPSLISEVRLNLESKIANILFN